MKVNGRDYIFFRWAKNLCQPRIIKFLKKLLRLKYTAEYFWRKKSQLT